LTFFPALAFAFAPAGAGTLQLIFTVHGPLDAGCR
jgi:hypothetical protein